VIFAQQAEDGLSFVFIFKFPAQFFIFGMIFNLGVHGAFVMDWEFCFVVFLTEWS
jgi:hypothetical protein